MTRIQLRIMLPPLPKACRYNHNKVWVLLHQYEVRKGLQSLILRNLMGEKEGIAIHDHTLLYFHLHTLGRVRTNIHSCSLLVPLPFGIDGMHPCRLYRLSYSLGRWCFPSVIAFLYTLQSLISSMVSKFLSMASYVLAITTCLSAIAKEILQNFLASWRGYSQQSIFHQTVSLLSPYNLLNTSVVCRL